MNITVKPIVFKTLRENFGLPSFAAAKKLGVTEDVVRLWESEENTFDKEALKEIAKFYKRHWSVFLLKEPVAKKGKKQTDLRSSNAIEFSYDTLSAFHYAERVLETSKEISGNTLSKNLGKYLSSNLTLMDIDELTESVRATLNFSITEQIKSGNSFSAFKGWVDAIEGLGIYVLQMKMPLDEVRAFTITEKNRAVIVINSADYVNSKIFSIIHELAHILMGTSAICDMKPSDILLKKVPSVEIFCNRFSGNLLLPRSVFANDNVIIKEPFNADVLRDFSRKYNVSEYVTLRRLLALRVINEEGYSKKQDELLKALKDKKPDFFPNKNTYTKSLIKKNSKKLTSELFNRIYENKISYAEVRRVLHMKSTQIARVESLIEHG